MSLTAAQATGILRSMGWRIRSTGELDQVVRLFQTGWRLGAQLQVDGLIGQHTSEALLISDAARRAGKGTASVHFSFAEFACHCGGAYSSCPRIVVNRSLLGSLEQIRERAYPRGMAVVSGFRCTRHNEDVAGATNSQHLYGAAADVEPAVKADVVASWHLAAGIGYNPAHLVRHVDRRDVSGHDATGGTLTRPTVWAYTS